jgi:hypothetical protein
MKELILMMKRYSLALMCLVCMVKFAPSAFAFDISGRWGIGLGTPYVGLKYGVKQHFSMELKGAYSEGVGIGGIRGYVNFNPLDRTVYFVGGELDYIIFDTEFMDGERLEGRGYVGGIFLGGELFFAKNISFSIDFGPYYLYIKDKAFSELFVESIDYVLNLAFYIYL